MLTTEFKVKQARHRGDGTYRSKCVKADVIDKDGIIKLILFFATELGLITWSFICTGDYVYSNSELFRVIKNIKGEEPVETFNVNELVGCKCYLDIDDYISYDGRICSEIFDILPMFKSENHRNEFFDFVEDNRMQGRVNELLEDIAESSADNIFDEYYKGTDEDFANLFNIYD